MRFTPCILILVYVSPLVVALHDKSDEDELHCSTLCDIVHDQTMSCFNGTRDFFAGSVVALSRNYVIVQASLNQAYKANNKPPISADEMVKGAQGIMNDVRPIRGYEDDVFPVDDVARVVKILAEVAVKLVPAAIPALECPRGCEHGSRLWLALFLASVAVNIVLAAIAIVVIMFMTRKNEKKARSILTRSEEQEKAKLQRVGHQMIVRKESIFPPDDMKLHLESNGHKDSVQDLEDYSF